MLDLTGRVVSTELVLVSDAHYYSFLGGTLQDAFVHAPNDLLKHAVIEHGHGAGKTHYVLGGGDQPGDGIFRFKLAFDPEGVVPFFGIQLVADAGLYDALVGQGGRPSGPCGGGRGGRRARTSRPTVAHDESQPSQDCGM